MRNRHPNSADDLAWVHNPHRPRSRECVAVRRRCPDERVTEVIDCWYERGAMPLRPMGMARTKNDEQFAEQFPADFISEAIDQTRVGFTASLAISTICSARSVDRRLPIPAAESNESQVE